MIFAASVGVIFLFVLGVRALVKANRMITEAEYIPGGKNYEGSR